MPQPQGELFLDEDDSDRGKIGHVNHHQKWCVNFKGVKFHIDSRLSGFTATIYADERPSRKTIVTTCDGSCKRLNKIPDNIWIEAKPQIIRAMKKNHSMELLEQENAGSVLLSDVTKEQLDIIHSAGTYHGA
jgi:hypothetical protein